jgi:SAM-dependent methyltransferase
MQPPLQRRIQRSGWDLASAHYDALWQTPLEPLHNRLLDALALKPGERVLDVACGSGLVTAPAARAVGPAGEVLGVDLSERMLACARQRLDRLGHANARLARMDAESLEIADASFDVALCSLGLMYLPDPLQALREMQRVLRPGGRLGLLVWGEQARCAWSALIPIVDAEIASPVCPHFFRLNFDSLYRLGRELGFTDVQATQITGTLNYPDHGAATDAFVLGGPIALAWARFDTAARARVIEGYREAIAAWQDPTGYALPCEFVLLSARKTGAD